jgi:GTP cyclohydrolase II
VVNSNRNGFATSFGKPEHVAVERGLAEFRSVRPVIITGGGGSVAALPVDGMTDEQLAAFRRLCAPAKPYLLITARRAEVLGLAASGPVGLAIGDRDDAAAIESLAADVDVDRNHTIIPASKIAGAAIELAKLAQRIPALLIADGETVAAAACDPPLIRVSADAVAQFRQAAVQSLAVATEASVPLNGGLPARFVIFRDAIGGSSVAVIAGVPDFARPVPVRMHSACLT